MISENEDRRQTLEQFTFDGMVGALWKLRKHDTAEIAKMLHARESRVANRLAWLREAGAL